MSRFQNLFLPSRLVPRLFVPIGYHYPSSVRTYATSLEFSLRAVNLTTTVTPHQSEAGQVTSRIEEHLEFSIEDNGNAAKSPQKHGLLSQVFVIGIALVVGLLVVKKLRS